MEVNSKVYVFQGSESLHRFISSLSPWILTTIVSDLSNPPHPLLNFVLRQLLTCKQIATFTLQPKVVLTARGESPKSLKIFEKDWVSAMRGLSSATTMHVRTQDRFTFRSWRWKIEVLDQKGQILWKHTKNTASCKRNLVVTFSCVCMRSQSQVLQTNQHTDTENWSVSPLSTLTR